MSRIAPAAVQLIRQVTHINPRVAVKAVDLADGFGRHRSIEFDSRTSKWLAPTLDAIQDERIESVDYEGKGRAVVNFVGDTRADHATDYPLEAVKKVLDEG